MKMNKYFMLGLAGLAFAACSNEENLEGVTPLDGKGVVTVQVVSPETLTKAMPTELPDATIPSSVKVLGDIKVVLTADEGGDEVTLNAAEIASGTTTVKFWNVSNPTKVVAYMNGAPADGDYSAVSILDYQQEPEDIPAYGEATPQLTDQAMNPDLDEENVVNVGDDLDEDTRYQMYEATVVMEIPVARLEVSGIKHIISDVHETADCEYKTLSIDGIYLDNIKATYGAQTYSDYQYKADGAGTGAKAILSYDITAPNNDFLAVDAEWPAENGKAYAFNFFPGNSTSTNPVLKIHFENAEAADGQPAKSAPRYAMITKYVAGTTADNQIESAPALTLEAGKIYRITDTFIDDKNILGDEGGNTLYGVIVKVQEATWAVETIKADWSEGTN